MRTSYHLHSMRQLDGRIAHFVSINGVDYLPTPTGVIMIYPCGTKRFISNGWYDN